MINERGAYQEMCAAVRAIDFAPAMSAIVGYTPELRYVDVVYPADPPKAKVWMRFSIVQAGESKRTLQRPSRVTYQGVAVIQLFVPVTAPNPAELGRRIADQLMFVYASNTANVDFTRASLKDMPREDAWFCKNVNANYSYDNYV